MNQPIHIAHAVQQPGLSWENNSQDVAAQIATMWHRRNIAAHWAAASSTNMGTPPVLLHGESVEPLLYHGPGKEHRVAVEHNIAVSAVGSVTVKIDEQRVTVLKAGVAKAAPPIFGDKLGYFLLSPERQDEVLGDLRERFTKRWLPALGPFGAQCCYLWQLLRVSGTLKVLAAVASVLGYFKFKG